LTPDSHGRAGKQEKLAELTGIPRERISELSAFGHWQIYVAEGDIKPTLREPLFSLRALPGLCG
jgi:hypothetical protein